METFSALLFLCESNPPVKCGPPPPPPPTHTHTFNIFFVVNPASCRIKNSLVVCDFRHIEALSMALQWQHPWWRHPTEIFSTILALCAGITRVTGEFPSQRPVTRSFEDFFDLRLNKRLGQQSRRWWFETPSRSLWRHCNATACNCVVTRYVNGVIIASNSRFPRFCKPHPSLMLKYH